MSVKLNDTGLAHARSLVRDGKATHDERDDWSEHAPTAADENAFIEKHGWEEFGQWHLGVDTSRGPETKGRYSFPYGDFRRVHRCAVVSLESRAGQYDHDDIETAAKNLLNLIDGGKD